VGDIVFVGGLVVLEVGSAVVGGLVVLEVGSEVVVP